MVEIFYTDQDGKTVKAVTAIFNRETIIELAASDLEKIS